MTSELFTENAAGLLLAGSMFVSFVITGLYLVTMHHLAKAIQRETPSFWEELANGRQVLIGHPPFAGRLLFGDSSVARARLGVASQSVVRKCRSLFFLGLASWIATASLMFIGSQLSAG